MTRVVLESSSSGVGGNGLFGAGPGGQFGGNSKLVDILNLQHEISISSECHKDLIRIQISYLY